MEWRDKSGIIYTWLGPADAEGRSHGHGVLEYPAKSVFDRDEGIMVAGRRQDTWIGRSREGDWRSYVYADNTCIEIVVRLVPPVAVLGGASESGARLPAAF
jgi:hypothetical protein